MTDPQQLPVPADTPGPVLRVAFGADHAGRELKNHLADFATTAGYEVSDLGTHSDDSVDYPDYGGAVARAVRDGVVDRGVLVCGTGVGMAMAANKVAGARAAVVHDGFTAYYSREHNDANVLCLGARVVGEGVAVAALATFLATEFGGGRHTRRVQKFAAIEESERTDG